MWSTLVQFAPVDVALVLLACCLIALPVIPIYFLAHGPKRHRWLIVILLVLPLFSPLLLRSWAHPLLTWIVAVRAVIASGKAYDYYVTPPDRNGPKGSFLKYLLFHAFWGEWVFSTCFEPLGAPPVRVAARAWLQGTVKLLSALFLMTLGAYFGLPDSSRWLDVALKAVELYLIVSSILDQWTMGFALFGYRIQHIFLNLYAARSVRDFWFRATRQLTQFYNKHVFHPLRVRWGAVAGLIATFALTDIIHEYEFVIVVPELIGLQTLFWSMHAIAILVELKVSRFLKTRFSLRVPFWLSWTLTALFVYVSLFPFMICMDAIIDLHADVGSWLLTQLRDL